MGLVSPFSLYNELTEFLRVEPRFHIRPMKQFMKRPKRKTVSVTLRHDIDGDIITAIRAARSLSDRSIPGSFYLLHTSSYYGFYEDGVFLRNIGLHDLIDKLMNTNVEVGLHIDPLEVYQNWLSRGTESIVSEVNWLRKVGVDVAGVVAHNSAPRYGAENFELFRGLSLGGRNSVTFNDLETPLQTLSLRSLGLAYEGNFTRQPDADDSLAMDCYLNDLSADSIRSTKWLKRYFLNNPVFGRRYDASVWLLESDGWMFAVHRKDIRQLQFPLSTEDLKRELLNLRTGTRVMFNIHPEYVAG